MRSIFSMFISRFIRPMSPKRFERNMRKYERGRKRSRKAFKKAAIDVINDGLVRKKVTGFESSDGFICLDIDSIKSVARTYDERWMIDSGEMKEIIIEAAMSFGWNGWQVRTDKSKCFVEFKPIEHVLEQEKG